MYKEYKASTKLERSEKIYRAKQGSLPKGLALNPAIPDKKNKVIRSDATTIKIFEVNFHFQNI